MLLHAELRLENGSQSLKFRVRNIFATGLMGEAPYEFVPGTVVAVDLRNIGTVPAAVVWSLDGRFGLAFFDEIDPARVRQMPCFAAPVGPLRTETADHVVHPPLGERQGAAARTGSSTDPPI